MRVALILAALLAGAAPAAAATGAFKTPSANIICGYSFGSGIAPSIACGIKTGLKPPPPPPAGGCQAGDYTTKRVSLRSTGRAVPTLCAGDPGPFLDEARARVLAYGRTWEVGGLWCISKFAGLTCGNASGHGFFLSRSRWRPY